MSTVPTTVPGTRYGSPGVLNSSGTSGGRFGALLFFSNRIVDLLWPFYGPYPAQRRSFDPVHREGTTA
jgi:hypothetical protein